MSRSKNPLIRLIIWLWHQRRQYVPRGSQPSEEQIKEFYDSWEWKRCRYKVGQKYGWCCMACQSKRQVRIDHIEPVRRNWARRLDLSNLQVLCNDCNMGKGSWDETDFRPRWIGIFGFFKR